MSEQVVPGARCRQCNGSGWDDKAGPTDDDLLDRAVLSAVVIDQLRSALHDIGAMVYMDQTGTIRFKEGYDCEAVLATANAALATACTSGACDGSTSNHHEDLL